ncbi:hypothetical protein CEXT_363341, partial [Caerostris extrusa]
MNGNSDFSAEGLEKLKNLRTKSMSDRNDTGPGLMSWLRGLIDP